MAIGAHALAAASIPGRHYGKSMISQFLIEAIGPIVADDARSLMSIR